MLFLFETDLALQLIKDSHNSFQIFGRAKGNNDLSFTFIVERKVNFRMKETT